jgi:hypothetical protein
MEILMFEPGVTPKGVTSRPDTPARGEVSTAKATEE